MKGGGGGSCVSIGRALPIIPANAPRSTPVCPPETILVKAIGPSPVTYDLDRTLLQSMAPHVLDDDACSYCKNPATGRAVPGGYAADVLEGTRGEAAGPADPRSFLPKRSKRCG